MASEFLRLQSELNLRKIELIKSDLETATTFASIAQDTIDDTPKRSRNRQNARKGYDAVVHYLHSATVSERERGHIEGKLQNLKKMLSALGERFGA